jgi:hypothetical protein
MPDPKNDRESMERSRGARREEQRGTESGSRIGKTHQPTGEGVMDDESDKFEGYDQRRR